MIPKEAKRVFKGKIFDTYQWQQKMFDGSYETFELIKRPSTTQVIAVEDNKILIAKEEQPTKPLFYGLFGGRVEEGEKPLEAAKREFLEETGMIAEKWELLRDYKPLNKLEWHIHVYVAKNVKKIAKQELESGEKIEIVSVSFDKFISMVINGKIQARELENDILRMKIDGKLDEFKKKLFSNIILKNNFD